ncbi:MAG: hypothetical protein AB7P49_00270 [Bdellovibrionales bacterium]
MSFPRLKQFFRTLWERFNSGWIKAAEIQRQIDERRAEHLRRHIMGGDTHDRFR